MRLDHLLSREKAEQETVKLIPRSMLTEQLVSQIKADETAERTARFDVVLALLYRFQGLPELPKGSTCNLTTAYEKDEI